MVCTRKAQKNSGSVTALLLAHHLLHPAPAKILISVTCLPNSKKKKEKKRGRIFVGVENWEAVTGREDEMENPSF